MTHADDPEELGAFGYPRRDGPMPKLVVVAIAWAAFGVVGLITALLMKSGGIAVFGVLCMLGGVGLYVGQRTREQLEHEEARLRADPWGEPEDGDIVEDDEPAPRPTSTEDDTTVYGAHEHDDDIVDAEFTEYFDYDQAPADQDDGTGYDEEEMAYQRYQADRRARETETADADVEEHVIEADDDEHAGSENSGSENSGSEHTGSEHTGSEDDEDDVARTSRIPTGGGDRGSSHHPADGSGG